MSELLNDLYNSNYGTTKGSEIKALFQDDLAKTRTIKACIKLYKKYEIYLSFGRNLGTVKNVYNDFKKLISDSNNKHKEFLLDIFSLPSSYYYVLNSTTSHKTLEDRKSTSNFLEINKKEFDSIRDYCFEIGMDKDLSKWDKGLGSRQTKEGIRSYFLATYLALVTGRRLTEILKTLELKKYKNEIRAKGLLKKEENDKIFTIILLDNAENVMTAYKELRCIFDCSSLSERECNNKYNNIFNRFLSSTIFNGQKISFSDLRAMFGEMAYLLYAEKDMDKKDFIESALVHESKIRAVDFYLNRVKAGV